MNTNNTNNTNTSDSNVPAPKSSAATVATVTVKPVNPFAVTCRFDRARGAFVVHAGARAGACAVLAFAVLAAGTFGFVRTTLRGPSTASAAELAAAEPDTAAEESPVIAAQPRSFSEYVRTPGLNYLVMKSFPNKKAADKAREALIRKGVATTVERSLPGWSGKGWYSLVGMTGFELDREQNLFDRHVKELNALKLDPKPYKWRGSETGAAERK